jgi:hypothetical protein
MKGLTMNEAFRTEVVETDAGPYTINLFPDYDAMNPMTDWDHEGMAFYIDGHLDTLGTSKAANALRTWLKDGYRREEIEQRYRLYKAMFGGWTLVTGTGWSYPQESWTWYVLADSEWTDPYSAANGTMESVEVDSAQRLGQANLVGAGFVGII